MKLQTLTTTGWDDYFLIDSGFGRKLERIGGYLIDRPEPQAMWTPHLTKEDWQKADAVFMGDDEDNEGGKNFGRWQNNAIDGEAWETTFGVPSSSEAIGQQNKLNFIGRLTSFRHVGYFPEQCAHWEWLAAQTAKIKQPKILNLFAYSGVHSLVAANAGAEVTHVDASKKAIAWAKENQELNNPEWKIRWIVDDVTKFVQREVKRGNIYDGIVLDPPKFGRGPDGETWDLFEDLPYVLEDCAKLLKPQKGSFLLLTSYAIRASSMAFGQLAAEYFTGKIKGEIETGELFVEEQETGRLLPTSMFTRVVIS